MRYRAVIALLAFMTALALAASPVTADDGDDAIYLSLGTSLAAGTQADETGANILFTDESYTDQLFDKLDGEIDDLEHVKLGCPGETVATFINGGICYLDGVSQLTLAQDALATGDVEIVTIDLGANDFLQATPAIFACGADDGCVIDVLKTIAEGVAGVIDALRAVDPTVPIVAMNYYNPTLAAWEGYFSGIPGQLPPDPQLAIASNSLNGAGNELLELVYERRGLRVADVAEKYKTDEFEKFEFDKTPKNVDEICELTYMCPDDPTAAPNIHPTKDGYKQIRDVFWEIIKEFDL